MKLKCLFAGLMASLLGFGVAKATPIVGINDVEAVTEVFGDGEHLSAVVLTYDKPISDKSVSPRDFIVTDRKISDVLVRDNSVILKLESLPMVAEVIPDHPKEDRMQRESQGKRGPTLGSHGNPKPLPIITAEVTQIGKVKAVDGTVYRKSDTLQSSHTRQLVVEDFIQDTYIDSDGATLAYNLYIPKNYDSTKIYPMVLFMHDAGAVSPEIKTALCQGNGATAWADPTWQAENPCFVLAPQYDTIIVDDNSQYGPELDRTVNLIENLKAKYSIDANRIYNTGQSMGGMTSIAMDIKYPNFFAASYLIACQWDANLTAPLANQNIWAVVSEGDPGACPGMAKILDKIESNGTNVIRQTIDAADLNKAADIIQPNCHHYETIFTGGSHRYTWQHAYSMKKAMQWIFTQIRTD